MKKCLFWGLLLSLLFELSAQTIKGKLVDQNGSGVAGVQLQLYISQKVYLTASAADGLFSFANITAVKKEIIPSGYSVSENYPNPFNPKTRIDFTLPGRGSLKVTIFNQLGQVVKEEIERNYSAGRNYIELELNGFPNGFYIARLTIDGKYNIIRKLMLLYGSQHLKTVSITPDIKIDRLLLTTKLDSLVATGSSIERKTFTNLPSINEGDLNLGDLMVKTISADPCSGILSVTYSGKTYNTVQIGSQCWLKENLDIGKMIYLYTHPTYTGVIEKYCYDNDTANCSKYGGLYKWNEAMQYTAKEKAQGICPGGWHIPSRAEFKDSLIKALNGNSNALKEIGQGTGSGAGTNTSGFSGLLAGEIGSQSTGGMRFQNMGSNGLFWSTTTTGNFCYKVGFYASNSGISANAELPDWGFPIRCLKDEQNTARVPTIPSPLAPINNKTGLTTPVIISWIQSNLADSYTLQVSEDLNFSSFVFNQNNITETKQEVTNLTFPKTYYWRLSASNSFGTSQFSAIRSFSTTAFVDTRCPGTPTVTDSRDGKVKVYNTIKIGSQCWLKENLDIGNMIKISNDQSNNQIIEKYCYKDDTANCSKYGGLYKWSEAMQYANGVTDTSMANPPLTGNVKGICPQGWHIPSHAEFQALASFVDNNGNKLKREDFGSYNGTGANESGFSALLTGHGDPKFKTFSLLWSVADFWDSSENYSSNGVGILSLSYTSDQIYLGNGSKIQALSIRCIQD